ncbi:MAG: membrane protein insertion efficiency factor YidD [Patescibacteria group bacterium]|jgi:hypothetical protein
MSLSVQQVFLRLIRVYQASLSPDHGWFRLRYPHGFCRFYPSCSQYAYESIAKHGANKGSWLAVQRICKCVPWYQGGLDLVK